MFSAAKSLWKLRTRLSPNYILKTVVEISRVPLDRFCLNRAYVRKYYLVSQESFFENKILFFYLQKTGEKMKKTGQNLKKNFKHVPFAQKNPPGSLL